MLWSMKTIACALVVVMGVLSVWEGKAAEKRLWAKSYLNQKAPEFVVEQWLTEKPELKGKFVLIDYWATWCGPCRKAIPELNEFQKKFKDNLVVIGISDESAEKVKGMKEPKIEYSSAIDTKERMKDKLEVKGIPHVILVDPDWVVRWEGYPLLDGHELTESVIKDVIAKHGAK